MKILCPGCEVEINHLNYWQDIRESGEITWATPVESSEDITSDLDYNCGDSETIDDSEETSCPDCGRSVTLRDLIVEFDDGTRMTVGEWEEAADRPTPSRRSTPHATPTAANPSDREREPTVIQPPTTNIDNSGDSAYDYNNLIHVRCEKDKTIILVEKDEASVECPKCGREIQTNQ
jgi:hypothetical protein